MFIFFLVVHSNKKLMRIYIVTGEYTPMKKALEDYFNLLKVQKKKEY